MDRKESSWQAAREVSRPWIRIVPAMDSSVVPEIENLVKPLQQGSAPIPLRPVPAAISAVRGGLAEVLQYGSQSKFKLTFCVKRDLYVPTKGWIPPFGTSRSRVVMGSGKPDTADRRVKQDARPRVG
jgi:hypothetical protein